MRCWQRNPSGGMGCPAGPRFSNRLLAGGSHLREGDMGQPLKANGTDFSARWRRSGPGAHEIARVSRYLYVSPVIHCMTSV